MRTITNVVASAAWAVLALVQMSDAFAVTRTWTGTTSGAWSVGTNWGGTAPQPGDDLAFPAGASNKSTNNDFAAGTSFNSITVNDVGYTLAGNAITLAGANALTLAGTTTGNVGFNLATTLPNAGASIALTAVAGQTQTLNIGGALTITGGSVIFNVNGNNDTVNANGAIGESGSAASLTKNGTAILNLNAANTYTGMTTVNLGYVNVGNNSALGTGTNSAADGTVVNSGGTVSVGVVTVANERIVLNGVGQSGNSAFQTAGGGLATWGGDVVLNTADVAFNLVNGPLTITGKVTGPGNLTFGRNTLTLTNAGNDWAGSTTIGSPTQGTHVLKLGASNVVPNGSAVSIADNGTLDVNGMTETIGSLAGTAGTSVTLGAGSLIVGGNNTSTTFDGTITGTVLSGLLKQGTGTMTLTAVNSGFLGTTTIVNSGAISVPSGASLANSTIMPGNQGAIIGNGTVGPIIMTFAGGGEVAPGIAGPGRLTASSFTSNQGDQLTIELNGTTPATQYDQLAVSGNVALNNSVLVFSLGFAASVGQQFRIIDNLGANPISGTFGNVPEGSAFQLPGPYGFTISYHGGDGNDVVLTVTQVPVVALPPPNITKAFGAQSIALNGVTSLTFTITNQAAGNGALTGVGFTDTLPAGLVVATPNGLSGSCGNGTITATAGSGTVSLAGTASPQNSSCSFSVNVTGTTTGQKNNSVTVTSNEGGTGNTSNASVTVTSSTLPPTITKSFGAASIALNATTTLTFALSNPNQSATLNNIGFTDTLPAGLVVATPNGLSGSCGNGTITATAGSNVVSLSGTTGAAAATCTFSVNVTGTTSGQKNNSVTVTSTEGTGNTSNATVTVGGPPPPAITKVFGAQTIALNATTSLTFTITNQAQSNGALTGVAFTDSLPSGVIVSTPNGLAGSCGGGTITATAGTSSVGLAGAALAAGASCTFSVNVTGTTAGAKNNSVSVTSTEGGAGNTSTAALTVVAPATIAKQFGTGSLAPSGVTTLAFTLANPNSASALTGVGFTDVLPAGLVVTTPNGLIGTCGGGTISATAGSGTVGLAGATLAASTSCTFTVNVTATGNGAQNNTTGAVTSNEGGSGSTASASLFIGLAPPPSANIPTLQHWALALLALLLTLSALFFAQRRER